ncbi:TerC family protein [Ammoniphilus oxalaticus]|uniref:TerC family protein n=1 Tax=Ammoniphilus oxalaticus TaxID=66863 RepID=UPI00147680CE|nr:TerC family protein [Ammoniphilus oxalaticus]
MDGQFWLSFLNIIIIDLILSGDNAVVVGMASRRLPPPERKKAIMWGTVGAVGLRILFTGIITWLLGIPYLKLIGGFLLIWVALKLLTQQEDVAQIEEGRNLWEVIRIIVIADVVMSLDNVLAIGSAAKGNFGLVIFGLMLSIPLLMWGSAAIAKWMNEYPILVYFGSGVLVFVATSMMLEEPLLISYLAGWKLPYLDTLIPIMATGLALFIGKWRRNSLFTFHHVK